MANQITRVFTDHPEKVGESYFEHMGVAAWFAGWLLLAGGAALVHALVPALCERTASDIVLKLHSRMSERR